MKPTPKQTKELQRLVRSYRIIDCLTVELTDAIYHGTDSAMYGATSIGTRIFARRLMMPADLMLVDLAWFELDTSEGSDSDQ